MMKFADEIDWNRADDSTHAGPVPTFNADDVTEERAPVAPVSTFGAPVANDQALEVINAEDSALKAFGLDLASGKGDAKGGGLFFAPGTALADIGHANLDAMAEEYNALPDPITAIGGFQDQIKGEERKDIIADLAGFRVDLDGNLAPTARVAGGVGNVLEHTAWKQLVAIAGQNPNKGLSGRTRCERRIRCRNVGGDEGGGRSVFAIVSSDPTRGYTVFDGGEVADLVMRGLSDVDMAKAAKCDLQYDPETTRYRIRTILQAPVDIMEHRGVGRVHQVFFDVKGGDNGETSISGAMGVIRIRCLNASLAQQEAFKWHRTHRGDMRDIRRMVANAAKQWGVVAEEMRSVWQRASAEWYLDPKGGRLSVPEAITRMVANGLIPKGGLTAEEATDAYVAAWNEEESVHSAAGVIMALQRAAHETTWKTKWATDEIEEAASGLLYQHNYVLDEVRA